MTSCHWPYDDPNNENQNRTITNVDLLFLHVKKLGHNLHTSSVGSSSILIDFTLCFIGMTWFYLAL